MTQRVGVEMFLSYNDFSGAVTTSFCTEEEAEKFIAQALARPDCPVISARIIQDNPQDTP